ncbi:hypothetical protein GGS23DRAFT_562283, partial [Durotheca rogersii]|uniref:uncharacterized protein n=1 Tax=Durotheca rogersii TaxID=419775 RepID=UPI00221FEF50
MYSMSWELSKDAELGKEGPPQLPSANSDSSGNSINNGSTELYVRPVAERRYVQKIDMYLLPVSSILYFCRYTTGSNVRNAKTEGMNKDLGLVGEQYNLTMTLIRAPFVLLEPVQIMMVKRYGGRIVMSSLLFGWGIVSMCQAAMKDYAGILVCRLLIACFQSRFFGGCIFYLTLLYKRDELTFRWLTPEEEAAAMAGLRRDSTAEVDTSYNLVTSLEALAKPKMWAFMMLGVSTVARYAG